MVLVYFETSFFFFAIGLPLILHYAGNHQQSDYQMINTSASEAFVLLGVGTALWFIVFIYYIKQFLINLLLKKNGTIRLLEHEGKRKETVSEEFDFADFKSDKHRFEEGNTIGIMLDREFKSTDVGIDGQVVKSNIKP